MTNFTGITAELDPAVRLLSNIMFISSPWAMVGVERGEVKHLASPRIKKNSNGIKGKYI
jgi:hypothetical protein